jgi:hypothetical protein
MPNFHFYQSKKYLLSVALMTALSGCGSSSKDDTTSENTVDTSDLTEVKLRENVRAGMTQGIRSNITAVTTVASNSKVLGEATEQVNSEQSRKKSRRENNGFIMDQGDFSVGIAEDSLDKFRRMIDFSTIDQNKNVYRFDPRESQVCSDPAGISTPEDIANCQTLISHITFVVTVTKMDNKEVTSATTLFKYDEVAFAKTGFDKTSGYYEILLLGMRSLLLGINEIAEPDDKINVPSTMQGSVHIAFTAPSETSGSLTVSIPNAIKLINNTADKATQINIDVTDKLFSLSANGDTNTMEVEVSLKALDVFTTDNDDLDNSFPLQLILSSLTGKAVLTENGDKLMLTGVSANGVKLKVDHLDAMLLNLKPLDALIDATGDKTTLTLNKLLDLNFSKTNIRHYFAMDRATTDTLTVKADADQGTTLTEYAEDVIQVLSGNIAINVTGVEDPFELNASAGNCINNKFDVIECPAQE